MPHSSYWDHTSTSNRHPLNVKGPVNGHDLFSNSQTHSMSAWVHFPGWVYCAVYKKRSLLRTPLMPSFYSLIVRYSVLYPRPGLGPSASQQAARPTSACAGNHREHAHKPADNFQQWSQLSLQSTTSSLTPSCRAHLPPAAPPATAPPRPARVMTVIAVITQSTANSHIKF